MTKRTAGAFDHRYTFPLYARPGQHAATSGNFTSNLDTWQYAWQRSLLCTVDAVSPPWATIIPNLPPTPIRLASLTRGAGVQGAKPLMAKSLQVFNALVTAHELRPGKVRVCASWLQMAVFLAVAETTITETAEVNCGSSHFAAVDFAALFTVGVTLAITALTRRPVHSPLLLDDVTGSRPNGTPVVRRSSA